VRDAELFREVFGRFATGVAVVTTATPSGAGGMTANALCSLSLEPSLVLVCFENGARTLPLVRDAGRFGVNVLSAEQEELAAIFASKLPEEDKLDGVAHRIEYEVPLIDGSLAWAVCTLVELIAGGDHTIAIGEVTAMGLGEGEPLVWYSGRYHAGALRPSRRPERAGPRPQTRTAP
jgi:3-hydroxy-9,10-secoandrosta-1,3,5(10)-triene-9,17-dione monooxygenase reductase component